MRSTLRSDWGWTQMWWAMRAGGSAPRQQQSTVSRAGGQQLVGWGGVGWKAGIRECSVHRRVRSIQLQISLPIPYERPLCTRHHHPAGGPAACPSPQALPHSAPNTITNSIQMLPVHRHHHTTGGSAACGRDGRGCSHLCSRQGGACGGCGARAQVRRLGEGIVGMRESEGEAGAWGWGFGGRRCGVVEVVLSVRGMSWVRGSFKDASAR